MICLGWRYYLKEKESDCAKHPTVYFFCSRVGCVTQILIIGNRNILKMEGILGSSDCDGDVLRNESKDVLEAASIVCMYVCRYLF